MLRSPVYLCHTFWDHDLLQFSIWLRSIENLRLLVSSQISAAGPLNRRTALSLVSAIRHAQFWRVFFVVARRGPSSYASQRSSNSRVNEIHQNESIRFSARAFVFVEDAHVQEHSVGLTMISGQRLQ